MTKRIIDAGTDTYRATCGECGCRFTYEREDVTKKYVGSIRDVVGCPHCGSSVTHFGADGDRWPKPAKGDCV